MSTRTRGPGPSHCTEVLTKSLADHRRGERAAERGLGLRAHRQVRSIRGACFPLRACMTDCDSLHSALRSSSLHIYGALDSPPSDSLPILGAYDGMMYC